MNNKISRRVLTERLNYAAQMVEKISSLPLEDRRVFFSDERNVWTVESCLRRALEAVLDAGRHILAKGYSNGVTEYKQIAEQLQRFGVLNPEDGDTLRVLAGYRNRMVHFYHEIRQDELYEIARTNLDDVRRILSALWEWAKNHPEWIEDDL